MVSSNLRPHPVSFSARVVSASASRIVLLPDETVQETAELFIRAVSPQIIGRSLVRHHSDYAAMRVLAPFQIPVGLATGAVGGVYMLWLLRKVR